MAAVARDNTWIDLRCTMLCRAAGLMEQTRMVFCDAAPGPGRVGARRAEELGTTVDAVRVVLVLVFSRRERLQRQKKIFVRGPRR